MRRHARIAARRRCTPCRQRGFTLVEMLIATTIAGVLATLAYAGLDAPLRKARRSDALVALASLQMAEERWRSVNRRYATLEELGAAAVSPQKHYALRVAAADEDGFELRAQATGAQSRDAACRHLRVVVAGATVTQSSGPDESAANPPAENRRCWGL